MNGASLMSSVSQRQSDPSNIFTSRFTAPSRRLVIAWRHKSDFHTVALERSGAFFQRVSTTPQRILVPRYRPPARRHGLRKSRGRKMQRAEQAGVVGVKADRHHVDLEIL